jgi:hypothetical protein
MQDVSLIWGCKVEWHEDEVGSMGDVAQLATTLFLISRVQKAIPKGSKGMKVGGLPSKPLKFLSEDKIHGDSMSNFHLEEDHLKLLFKVHSEVENLKFIIEQLGQRISLLLALCTNLAQ